MKKLSICMQALVRDTSGSIVEKLVILAMVLGLGVIAVNYIGTSSQQAAQAQGGRIQALGK